MTKFGLLATCAMGFTLAGAPAFGLGIPAKAKAGKVQGNLVPAYKPSTGSGTGDDENDSPAFLSTASERSTNGCIFTQGKFKAQVGKDAAVQLKGVTCGTMPYTGQLCAHTKILSTIMDEEIDKTGASAAKTCVSVVHIEGKMNFVTGNIGLLTCTDGTCKGTLPVVTTDPCPDVDKVTELRRLEVFDGPDKASVVTLGTTLAACCGAGQTTVGSTAVSATAPCTTSTQDVMGEMGTITQGVP